MRTAKLERLVRERFTLPPLGILMRDPEQDPDQFLDSLNLEPADRERAFVIRWQTEAEAGDWEKRRREAEAWSKSYEPPLPEQVSEPGRSM
jgi:hypothetical protein